MKSYTVCAETNIGNVRGNNEDNFFCNGIYKEELSQNHFAHREQGVLENMLVLGVFDGMGGTQSGEEAACAAAEVLKKYVREIKEKESIFDEVYLIRSMNRQVCREIEKKSKNMGSTVVLLVYQCGKIHISNLGDSRAYLYRKKNLQQLSVDHTEENHMKMIKKSMGIEDETKNQNMKNTLTQHLGISEEEFLVEPFKADFVPQKGDIYLLCSDGLTGMVPDKKIAEILDMDAGIEEKKNRLMTEALKNGGKDNITVVLLGL